jgi:hypothetical protein
LGDPAGKLMDINKPFNVRFTAYIDGMQQEQPDAVVPDDGIESRRPELTQYHLNFYHSIQYATDLWLRGGHVQGAEEEVNVDTDTTFHGPNNGYIDWRLKKLGHKSIDDDVDVLRVLRERLEAKVQR